MIVVHIITKKEKQARMIIDLLLRKKLLLDAMVSNKLIYKVKKGTNEIIHKENYLIMGKTKALLFNKINQELKITFSKSMPSIYSMPIIYMDENQAKTIGKNIQLV